jgi:hypothetical protein
MSEPTRRVPDGSVELLMFAEGLVLADQADALLTAAEKIGGDGPQATVVLQFSGRINHSSERTTVNVALDARSAFDFAGSILDLFETALKAEGKL